MSATLKQRLIGLMRKHFGIDRAIAATTVTQLMRFVTGPITMLLMIRYLSREEQGFFYSFAGVAGIQVFLEAGFAQSISQFTSREFARLRFNRSGFLAGNPEALSRLRSIFQKANRYYLIMAGILSFALMLGGYFFFSAQPAHGVSWVVPWFIVSACAGLSFLLTPFWAVLDGCNRIAEVSAYRFWLTLVTFATSAFCLPMGAGIYVTAWSAIASLVFSMLYLGFRWHRVAYQIFRPVGHHQVSWRGEIWGFQWRIAGTWMSRYFLESGLAPLALQLNGPIVAGQIGMTFQMVRMIGGIANTWTVIRIPAWGALAAKGLWSEFNSAWSLAARRSVMFCALGLGAFFTGLIIINWFWPSFASRFLPPVTAAGLIVGWMLYSIWLVSMHYTRALRQEPYTFLHVAVGISFLVSCLLFSHLLGNATIPWMFAAVHVPAAIVAWRILHHIRAVAHQSA